MKDGRLFNDIAAHRLQIAFESLGPPVDDAENMYQRRFTGIGGVQSRNSPVCYYAVVQRHDSRKMGNETSSSGIVPMLLH